MSQIVRGGILLFLMVISLNSEAQNYYNAPYTRYSIGDFINSGFAANRAMGGSSIALRYHNQVNYLNPASYTSQDTNSFLFQVGFTARSVKIQTNENSDQSSNMNIEYLAMGFPVKKWLNLSIGLVPYSRIQYAFRNVDTASITGESMTYDYTGFGGFNEFYIGAGVTIKEMISLGINLNYLFGSLDRAQTSYLTDLPTYSASIEKTGNLIASDFYTKLGIQFHPKISDKHSIIIGATLDAKANVNVKLKARIRRYNTASSHSVIDTISYSLDTVAPIVLPNKFGVGFSYMYDDKLVVTGEYLRQDWNGTEVVASSFKTGLYESYRFGLDYIPVPLKSRAREKYYKRIHYRLGGYYTKTYLYHNGNNISDMGLTVGLGIPWKNARKILTGTSFNISYQYGIRGTTDNGLIKESYHLITVGFTLHDFWFLKPKYN